MIGSGAFLDNEPLGSIIAHRRVGGVLLVVSAVGFLAVSVNPYRAGLVALILLIAGVWRLRRWTRSGSGPGAFALIRIERRV